VLTLPFFSVLEKSQSVLLAGAGGGFDVFSGLPLYFALRASGRKVYLSNLAFTDLRSRSLPELTSTLFEVRPELQATAGEYFPELYLAKWLSAFFGQPTPIYTFERTGAIPMREGYRLLIERMDLDTVILIDGGTDSLLRGDETELGTPAEDMVSIAAVSGLGIASKLLVCLGFGIDSFHGVCHAQVLEAVADLIERDAYLGACSLTRDMPEVKLFKQAAEAVFLAMPEDPSIVCSSILAAINGRFGDYHATSRTRGSQLFINALMSFYWAFQLEPVAERVLYIDAVRKTNTWREVTKVIYEVERRVAGKRPWVSLPM
jgi:hypothetical protein